MPDGCNQSGVRTKKRQKRKKKDLEMPGIEPGAFHMQSERATTALHPLPCATNFSMLDLKNFLFMTDGSISLRTKS